MKFPAVTVVPVADTKEIHIRLFLDKSSVEAFGEDGRFVKANRIFPSQPYNCMTFTAVDGIFTVESIDVYKLD